MGVKAPTQVQILIEGINIIFVSGKPVFLQKFAATNKKLVSDPSIVWFEPLSQRPFKINPAGTFCPLEPINVSFCFDFNAGDQGFSNDTVIATTSNELKAFVGRVGGGTAGIAEIAGNQLRLNSSGDNAKWAFARMDRDLNTIRSGGAAGTWLLEFDWTITSSTSNGFYPLRIMKSLFTDGTGGAAPNFTDELIAAVLSFGASRDGFALGISNGAAFSFAGSSTAGGDKGGIKVACSLEKTATQFLMLFDIDLVIFGAPVLFSALITNTQDAGNSNFLHIGESRNDQNCNLSIDNLKIS